MEFYWRAARHAYRIGALGHAAVQGIWWERGPQVLQSVCALMCASIGKGGQRSPREASCSMGLLHAMDYSKVTAAFLLQNLQKAGEPVDKLWTL